MEKDYRLSEVRKLKKPGYKLNKFRKPTKSLVINRHLYGLMFVENLTTSELAKQLEINRSTVQKWIFEGRIPRTQELEKKVADILKTTPHAIFNRADIQKRLQEIDEA